MSIADDIRAAAATLTEPEAPTVESIDATPAEQTVSEVETAPQDATETTAETMARVRDDKGRFAPKKGEETKTAAPVTPKLTKTATTAPAEGQPTETEKPAEAAATATQPPKPAYRAPQSWKPAAREKWAALDPDVQAEIDRVDREVRQVMQESAPAKKFREQFESMVAPYRPLLTGEPLQVMQGLLQTAAQLRTAPPAQKAALVASIIKSYGVPVEDLDAVLSGEAPPQHAQRQAQPAVPRDPRLDIILQQMQQRQYQQLQSEMNAFAEKNEFFADVRDTMGRLMQAGIASDMQDAYNRACLLTPEIAGVLKQREEAAAAKAKLASTQRAREAGSLSVRSQPAAAPPPAKRGGSIMDDLMEAKDRLTQ